MQPILIQIIHLLSQQGNQSNRRYDFKRIVRIEFRFFSLLEIDQPERSDRTEMRAETCMVTIEIFRRNINLMELL